MKKSKSLLKVLLMFILGFCLVIFNVHAQDSVYSKIEKIVMAEAKHELFSGTVLVAKNGKVVYEKAVGFTDNGQRIPNTPNTRYNISSIKKSFTAVLVMQLIQENKLNLEDPLTKYFPDCPFKTADEIKISNLLNHTSGLGDYREHPRYQKESKKYKKMSDALPLVYKLEPEFMPGKQFNYSNTGYLLLDIIIEKVEKKGLEEVLDLRIYDPLGIKKLEQLKAKRQTFEQAFGHFLSPKSKKFVKTNVGPAKYSKRKGMGFTAKDLLKFDQALYSEELLSDEIKEIMFTPVEPSPFYGYGWIVVPFGGTTVIYHNGGSGGFSSEFRRYPEKGYTIVVLSNYDVVAHALTNKIDAMILDQPYTITTEGESFCRKAKMFRSQGDLSEANELYKAAVALSDGSIIDISYAKDLENGINSLAYDYLNDKNILKAIDLFQMNCKIFPTSANTYDSLAEAYMKSGQTDLAISNYEKVLQLDPNNEIAKENLKMLKEI